MVAPIGAAFFTDDPDMAATWAACEEAHPYFDQTDAGFMDEPAMEALLAELQVNALEFAARARAAGHTWMPDPAPGGPTIYLPNHITAEQFRDAIVDALDPEAWVPFEADDHIGFDWWVIVGDHTIGVG